MSTQASSERSEDSSPQESPTDPAAADRSRVLENFGELIEITVDGERVQLLVCAGLGPDGGRRFLMKIVDGQGHPGEAIISHVLEHHFEKVVAIRMRADSSVLSHPSLDGSVEPYKTGAVIGSMLGAALGSLLGNGALGAFVGGLGLGMVALLSGRSGSRVHA